MLSKSYYTHAFILNMPTIHRLVMRCAGIRGIQVTCMITHSFVPSQAAAKPAPKQALDVLLHTQAGAGAGEGRGGGEEDVPEFSMS